jgi:hypothetical protein
MPAIAFRPRSLPLERLHERALVAAITTEKQHTADVAVRQVELRRERLGWAAIAFGSLEVVLPSEPPEWTAEQEPHWPLTDGARLLLRFGLSADDLRFSVLRSCACGTETSTGRIDPRDAGAVAEIGEALQTRARCLRCRLSERRTDQQLLAML